MCCRAGSIRASVYREPRRSTASPRRRRLADGRGRRRFAATSGGRRARGLVAMGLMVIFGPMLWRTSISDIDFAASNVAVSLDHPMGTDDLGRDTFARILLGGRVSIAVGLAAMLVAMSIGTVGAPSGFLRVFADPALMRLTDVFLALPPLPLLLLVTYLFRDSVNQLLGPELGVFVLIALVIGGALWMGRWRGWCGPRSSRSKEKEFVEAARPLARHGAHHAAPHPARTRSGRSSSPATLVVAASIITESALSSSAWGAAARLPPGAHPAARRQAHIDSAAAWSLFPGDDDLPHRDHASTSSATACATPSIRGKVMSAMPLPDDSESASIDLFFDRRGELNAVNGVSFDRRAARRSASSASRAAARGDRALDHAADPEPPGRIVAGQILFRRPGPASALDRGADAPDPRQPDRDDLPGADDLAQPGASPSATRSPRRSRLHQRASGARRHERAVELLELVGIPHAGSARSTSIRTSSRAACASA